jgi:hypothetical protein
MMVVVVVVMSSVALHPTSNVGTMMLSMPMSSYRTDVCNGSGGIYYYTVCHSLSDALLAGLLVAISLSSRCASSM